MPGRALMTEYRRSYRPSQFRCAVTTYITNREFRLQQLQRFQNHSTDPFIWPDDEDDEDDVTPGCDGGRTGSRREPFEPEYQYRHRQLKDLYERRARSIDAQDVVRQRRCNSDQKDFTTGKPTEARNDSGCSSSAEEDDHSSIVHVVGPSQHDDCNLCMESKQTQTPPGWCPSEKPPFALYGHRHNEKETGAKKTYNIKASHEISPSALRAKQLRQPDKPSSATLPSLRRVDRTKPVLVSAADDRLPSSSAWTSEYEHEYQPYERSRYRAQVDSVARRLHSDLKPATPRTHRSYLVTC